MKKYAIGDYFVLRNVNDLKLAAKKLEEDGYQVYANNHISAREHVGFVVQQSINSHGFAVLGIDKDGDVIAGTPSVAKRPSARLYFGDIKPKERPLIG